MNSGVQILQPNEVSGEFNVRVYAIIFNECGEVLLADEHLKGDQFTKFPGGGLEFGEGTIDCILRECREELGIAMKVVKHYYTTDFFQASAFHAEKQIISIYYVLEPSCKADLNQIQLRKPLNFSQPKDESFRWVPVDAGLSEALTFPIDKRVGEMLVNH